MVRILGVMLAFGLAGSSWAGQVPSPLNAVPTMPANHAYASGPNAQQPVDGGPITNFGPTGLTTVTLKCDGSADNSAALQAILNQPNTIGILPAGGVCTFSTPLVSTASNNGFQCAVGPTSVGAACQLKYTGASGGKMISFITSSSAQNRLRGSRLDGVTLNGNGLASDAVYGEGLYGFHFDNLTMTGGFNGGYTVDIEPVQVASGTTPGGDSTTSQDGTIDNLTVFNSGGASGGVKAGYFPGGTNTSINLWKDWAIVMSATGTGFYCPGCDNIEIDLARFFGSGTAPSIDLSCGGTGSNLYCANGIVFDHVSTDHAVIARGTPSFPCVAYVQPRPANVCSWYNELRNIDQTNGSPQPTIEAGAQLHFNTNYGQHEGYTYYGSDTHFPGIVLCEDFSEVVACDNNSRSIGSAKVSSAYFGNAATGPWGFFDNLNGSQFYFRPNTADTTSDAQWNRLAGTGSYRWSTANGIFEQTFSAKHFGGTGSAPTIAAGTGAGTSPTIALDANAHDGAFDIILTTGSTPTASGVIATVSFNAAYANQVHCPTPGVENAATAALSGTSAVISTPSNVNYVLTAGSAGLAASTAYRWSVTCVQ